MIFVTMSIIFYVSESKIDHLDSLLTWFFGCMTTVVCGYLGIATFDESDYNAKKNNKKMLIHLRRLSFFRDI
jgi:hypothetical protein